MFLVLINNKDAKIAAHLVLHLFQRARRGSLHKGLTRGSGALGTKIIKSSQLSRWHKLDNSARIFPAASSVTASNVFRLACVLREPVNPALLQQALDATISGFPAFAVRMRAGFFWYYFESNPKTPVVAHEKLYPCAPMNRKENDGFLFRLLYHDRRISLETYHALTDGTGGLEFLRAITGAYLALAHAQDAPQNWVPSHQDLPNAAVLADGYRDIYQKSKGVSPFTGKAYRIRGNQLPYTAIKVLHGQADTGVLLQLARNNGVTITALLSALLSYSIYTERMGSKASDSPVVVTLPVNLRGVFGGVTAQNFFECVDPCFTFDRDDIPFAEVLASVSVQLTEKLKKENLIELNAYKVGFSRMLGIRLVPLFLKNLLLSAAARRGELAATSTLSNLGRVQMPDWAIPHIDRFEFILSPTEASHIKCAVCSFGDKLVITFSSSMEQHDVQRAFFRHLAAMGATVTVEANYRFEHRGLSLNRK